MQILQVNSADMGGGAEGSAWNLFQAYRSLGHDSCLVVGEKHTDDPDVLPILNDASRNLWARLLITTGTPLRHLKGKVRGAGRLYDVLYWIGQPKRWLKRQQGYEDFDFPGTWQLLNLTPELPDIIHCHNLHGGYFDLRVLPSLSHQVPVILNLRDTWLLTGHCAYFLDCERWKTGCGQCPYLHIYPAAKRDKTAENWQCKRDIYEKSRLYITTPSQWLMDKVQMSMLHGVQSKVIPNAVDLSVFCPGDQAEARSALELPANATIVLLIAHSMYKDYNTMETAVSKLEKTENDELIFICLGKKGTERVTGQGRMIYRGFERNPNRLAHYYRASDVFIHAAKDEAFGKTITEALACGVPVVATAVGGIPEQIEDGKNGFLVPARDSSAMAEAINCLLDNPDLRLSMGQAGSDDARVRFGLKLQVNAFLSWYQEILKT